MVTLDWSVAELEMKEGLKSVLAVTGELFVTMAGMIPMLLLLVVNLGLRKKVWKQDLHNGI